MLDLTRALQRGAPFFSFVIGLGVSILIFHRDYAIMKIPALPLQEIVDKVVKTDGKCYRYRVEDASCENPSSR